MWREGLGTDEGHEGSPLSLSFPIAHTHTHTPILQQAFELCYEMTGESSRIITGLSSKAIAALLPLVTEC